MGRKYIRARKYIFLCTAGLILFSIFGCATFQGIENRHNARKSFVRAKSLLAEGDFNGAIKENEEVLNRFRQDPPGDQALFNMGLIYAHQDNPEMNYQKSRDCFAVLVNDYPDSSLADEAGIWVSILDFVNMVEQERSNKNGEIAARDKQISDLKQLVVSQILIAGGDYKKSLDADENTLSHNLNGLGEDDVLFNMGLMYANNENPDKDFKKSFGFFRKLIKEYPQSPLAEQAKVWVGVLNIIEKSKQVDIEIEKKKKELER